MYTYVLTLLHISGATTALVIAYNSSPLILMAYAYTRGLHRQTWGGWSWDSLREWGQFLRLGVPGLLMTCIEWWSFEVATFVTGSIDDTQLAIYSIVMTIFSVFYQVSSVTTHCKCIYIIQYNIIYSTIHT